MQCTTVTAPASIARASEAISTASRTQRAAESFDGAQGHTFPMSAVIFGGAIVAHMRSASDLRAAWRTPAGTEARVLLRWTAKHVLVLPIATVDGPLVPASV